MPYYLEPRLFISKNEIRIGGRVLSEEEQNKMNKDALAILVRAFKNREQERLMGRMPPLGSKR